VSIAVHVAVELKGPHEVFALPNEVVAGLVLDLVDLHQVGG
jgi:hypothetical protein